VLAAAVMVVIIQAEKLRQLLAKQTQVVEAVQDQMHKLVALAVLA
jgi:hypothetical protein